MSGQLGVYLLLPFGLGPSPRWDGKCVKGVLRIADFVDGLHSAEEGRGREQLFLSLAQPPSLLTLLGIRCRE